MKVLILCLICVSLVLLGCGSREDSSRATQEETPKDIAGTPSEKDALNRLDPTGVYGVPIEVQEEIEIASVLERPEALEGERVLVRGTVAEVCPRRGCWIELVDGDQHIRVKVTDGEIVFPLSAKGHEAKVEGVVEKIELDEEQARGWAEHEAQETGEVFDPATVTGPMVIWRIKGMGAEIS